MAEQNLTSTSVALHKTTADMPTPEKTSPATSSGGHRAAEDIEACPSNGNHDEFVQVDLSGIRKDVQCPICLGIIRKTRTVMECLHRFCRECIDKSMRLGNNECPVCRTHCASRRSLRDDLNFDALIAALYPNVDTYEEEELALREEDERRNKQLQASIAETSERQSDAIARRYTTAKATAAAIVRKAHNKLRNIQNQNRGRSQGQDNRYGGDDEFLEQYGQTVEIENASAEKRLRRRKREAATFLLEDSDDEQGRFQENKALHFAVESIDDEGKGETSTAYAGKWEGLTTWARAGARSHMRYGNLNSGNNRHVRCSRATVLFEALSQAANSESDAKFDVHFILQPSNPSDGVEKLPSLEKPNLCCPANVTVQHLCKFLVSRLSVVLAGELELVVGSLNGQSDFRVDGKPIQRLRGKAWNDGVESCKAPEILHPQSTLGQIYAHFWHGHGNLVIMYRRKM